MINKVVRTNLVAIAKAYAEATGVSLATVSRTFHGNQKFFKDFGDGAVSITVSKMAEMIQEFSNRWPTGTKWPRTKAISMTRPPRNSVDNFPS